MFKTKIEKLNNLNKIQTGVQLIEFSLQLYADYLEYEILTTRGNAREAEELLCYEDSEDSSPRLYEPQSMVDYLQRLLHNFSFSDRSLRNADAAEISKAVNRKFLSIFGDLDVDQIAEIIKVYVPFEEFEELCEDVLAKIRDDAA